VVVLAMCMLLTGTINTIATKYQVGVKGGAGVVDRTRCSSMKDVER